MAASYAPLELLSGIRELYDGDVYDKLAEMVQSLGLDIRQMGAENFINATLSVDSPNRPAREDFKKLHSIYLDMAGRILLSQNPIFGKPFLDIHLDTEKVDILTEVKDLFVQHMLVREWSYNKQVFKPDEDFAKCLILTDNLVYTRSMIEHMPVRNFYIDLSGCPYFYPLVGIFFDIRFGATDPDRIYVTMNGLSDNLDTKNNRKERPGSYSIDKYMLFSYYCSGELGSDGGMEINVGDVKAMEREFYSPIYTEESLSQNRAAAKNMQAAYALGLQLAAYLSVETPDLEEDPVTKQTYRKREGEPKNRFSEVRSWDVGYRYGSEFRKKTTAYKAEKDGPAKLSGQKRKSPIPHFRCAHWQRHRYGKGRTETRLVWHEPVFVMGRLNGGADSPAEAVIHKVKKM